MVCDLPAGVRAVHARSADGHRAILVSRALDPAERRAALAHELVHDERGGGCHTPGLPDRLRPLVAREEARVERIAARRLLPAAELASWVGRRLDVGDSVSPADVVAEWDVPHHIAALALIELAEEAA